VGTRRGISTGHQLDEFRHQSALAAWGAAPAPHQAHVGFAVHTLSGKMLGVVEAVDDWRFRMSTHLGRRWLRNDAIYRVEVNDVLLICEECGVDRYKAE
jgi:hypothetical protein